MKRIIVSIIMIICLAMPVSAEEPGKELANEIDIILGEYNIDFSEIQDHPTEVFTQIIKKAFGYNFNPVIQQFCRITIVLFVSSLIGFFAFEQNKHISGIIETVLTLIIFYSSYQSLNDLLNTVFNVLTEVKDFMVSFLPVFAGVSFASGQYISSTLYTGFFLMAVISVANFCTSYIIPSINLYLAVGVTSTVSSLINLKPLYNLYTRIVKFSMTTVVSVLCFVLSIQTTIAQGKDGLALKAGKMIVSTAIPVIGSALENAVSTIYSSMGVMKTFFGIAGIAVVTGIFLPSVISIVANWICYQLLVVISTVLENKLAADLIDCFRDIMEILLSMCILFLILLVFSITVMIKATGIL